jgi:hypothetical protein
MKKILFLFFLTTMVLACAKPKPDHITNAVYVWDERSQYNYLSTQELEFLKANKVEQLYCKLTDVSWDEIDHAYPHDIKRLPDGEVLKTFMNIVPCVFIENEVMLKSTREELEYMAEKIAARIKKYDTRTKYCQIDCDWSAQSKDNYFFFLTRLKHHLDVIKLSVTLRLYQYKYPDKTGVPPADRAMLMLYNFNSPSVLRKENSIFDKAEAIKYVTDKKYNLPIDFALPAFSWNIVYNHEDKFIGYLALKDDHKNISYLKPTSDNLYEITQDTTIDAYYLRKGYKLKAEQIKRKELKEAYGLIDKFKNTDTFSVALFDLNDHALKALIEEDNELLYNSILVK